MLEAPPPKLIADDEIIDENLSIAIGVCVVGAFVATIGGYLLAGWGCALVAAGASVVLAGAARISRPEPPTKSPP